VVRQPESAKREHGVRLAVRSDLDEMRDSLVEAFEDDPVVCWIYADAELRRSQMREWYELTLVAGLRAGHTYTASHNRAVAMWAPPSVDQLYEWDREGIAIAEMLQRHLGARTEKVLNGLLEVERAHSRNVPHFYLAMLGTAPEMQGKGAAGALLEEVLWRCDAENWPAYLETSLDRNVAFYERRGFRVTGEMRLKDGPPVWFMWRYPEP
jgi:GNAT superfamily N-acetyltransferase